jgi:tRNA (Thr-GGU) A37 N-methylase
MVNEELTMLDGTQILDIKPYLFQPTGRKTQTALAG